ncbi:hypothetical protein CJ226_09065 [Microbacterium sp. UMB0228]|nr:hypothetical protein CJ226_09065 [Microbacterium sp. UMB0228]
MSHHRIMTPEQMRGLAIDVLIPIAAILVPTLISIGLYRAERKSAAADRAAERRLEAGAEIARAIAPLATFDGTSADMRQIISDLRGRITIYRAWTAPDDIVGDWLALRFKQLMKVWGDTLGSFDPAGMSIGQVMDAQSAAHDYSAETAELLTGWLAGHISTETIRQDGANILAARPDLSV